MEIKIFQSNKGDCLMIEGGGGGRILCDGGMGTSMREAVAPELEKLHAAGEAIDLLYVSHIDEDHIGGVLLLLRNALEWKVDAHHQRAGNPVRRPTVPKVPPIGGIWHNAFHDQVGRNAKPITELLAAAAPAMIGARAPQFRRIGEELYDIATSVPQAIEVSKLVAAAALDIPLNRLPGEAGPGKLLMLRPGAAPSAFGSLRVTIVGPTSKELSDLKAGWNRWLEENPARVAKIDEEVNRRLQGFAAGAPGPIDLGKWNGVPDFEGVTAPNIASLMLMVEDGPRRVLLTGDAHHKFILDGLRKTGFLNGGGLHIDALKVQHHGATANMDADFAARASADHYLFCGNGSDDNPELEVIKLVFESRMGSDAAKRARAAPAGRPFKFWFSTDRIAQPASSSQRHMAEVRDLVAQLEAQAGGQMQPSVFNGGAFVSLRL